MLTWNAPEAMNRMWSVLTGAVLGRNRRALDQRQQVALHAFAARAGVLAAARHLVDLVDEHDAVVLAELDRLAGQLVLVEQLVGLVRHQERMAVLDLDLALLALAAQRLADHLLDVDDAAGLAGDVEHALRAGAVGELDFDVPVVALAGTQLLAEALARRRAGAGADQRIEHALFGGELGAGLHVLALALAHLGDRDLDEIAHDLLDIAADIADLGEFRGFDLEEGRACKYRQPSRDLGLADAGGSDHQDVFRQYLFAQAFR